MKAFLGFQQNRTGPTPSHVRIPPAFDVAAQIAGQREAALDDIRTGQGIKGVRFILGGD